MGYFKNKLIEDQVELGDRVPAPKPAADHVALQGVEFEHHFASQRVESAELSEVKNKAFDDGWNHGFAEAFDEGWEKGWVAHASGPRRTKPPHAAGVRQGGKFPSCICSVTDPAAIAPEADSEIRRAAIKRFDAALVAFGIGLMAGFIGGVFA